MPAGQFVLSIQVKVKGSRYLSEAQEMHRVSTSIQFWQLASQSNSPVTLINFPVKTKPVRLLTVKGLVELSKT